MSSANYIFSLASVAAFLRCEKRAPTLTQSLLKNLSITFGDKDGNDGLYIYNTYKKGEHIMGFRSGNFAKISRN